MRNEMGGDLSQVNPAGGWGEGCEVGWGKEDCGASANDTVNLRSAD